MPTVGIVSKEDTPLEALSTYAINYLDGRPQEMPLYFLIMSIMNLNGEFPEYTRFADELKNLPTALNSVREQADEKGRSMPKNLKKILIKFGLVAGIYGNHLLLFNVCA